MSGLPNLGEQVQTMDMPQLAPLTPLSRMEEIISATIGTRKYFLSSSQRWKEQTLLKKVALAIHIRMETHLKRQTTIHLF